MKNIKARL